jgi:hypothetical protein
VEDGKQPLSFPTTGTDKNHNLPSRLWFFKLRKGAEILVFCFANIFSTVLFGQVERSKRQKPTLIFVEQIFTLRILTYLSF